MQVTVTGATGLLGPALVSSLLAQGVEVTVLSRDPQRAERKLPGVQAIGWDPLAEPAPAAALVGRIGVVHLAGEPIAQRWSAQAKRAIRESRVLGTRNLIAGLCALDTAAEGAPAGPRPRVLISGSAVGYYGPHGDEPLDEEAPPGHDFLAQVCREWESEAQAAVQLGMRVVLVRTGVVLDPAGGALAKMLPPFRLGLGGPVAGGRQYLPWIHGEDYVEMVLVALRDPSWSGAVNATAPTPVTNGEFSKALGHALRRPAFLPVPGLALRALYGEMAEIVTSGARVLPAKPLMLGYRFRHPELEEALGSALG